MKHRTKKRTEKAIASLLLACMLLLCCLPSAQAAVDDNAVVSFLGPAGTYTEQAAERLFLWAAKVYGLQVLAESIQGSDSNVTRFYLVSTQPCFTDAPERMTFSATGPAEALPDLLTAMDAQGLRLITLHDRPAKTILGEYVYLLECSGGGQDAYEQLAKECGGFALRHLGSYLVTAGD